MLIVKNVIYNNENIEAIRFIRNTVFICEQSIAPEIEFDELDDSAIHVLAYDDVPIATGRMLSDGHIGRIAVLKEYRSQGIGMKIVESLIHQAVENKYDRVYLGAQKQAIKFYSKLGFTPYGSEFIQANIIHLSMEKILK